MDKPQQEHQFGLLVELVELCRELDVPCVLANHTLWDAAKLGCYNRANYETAVLVSSEGLKTLLAAELPEHRELQPFDRRGCPYRYADTSTVLLDYRYDRFGAYPCPGVDVSVATRNADGTFAVRKPDGRTFAAEADLFDGASQVEFEGRLFDAPAHVDRFFDSMVGAGWRESRWPFRTKKVTGYMVFLPGADPKAFRADPDVRKTLSPGSFLIRTMYRNWVRKFYRPKKKRVEAYGLYLQRTEDRFDLWERYYPQKDRLRALVSAGDDAELESFLQPLIGKTVLYCKRGMGLCVDEELLQAVIPFVLERCKLECAEDLLDLMPKAHREKPIEELLRERGVDHPLLK